MHRQASITIVNELDLRDMQCASDVACTTVLDLRLTHTGTARPVEEDILLRLRNLQVQYQQLPVDTHDMQDAQKAKLMACVEQCDSRMMIITDQPDTVNALFRTSDLREIHVDCAQATNTDTTVPHLQVPQFGQDGSHQSVVN